MRLLIDTHVFVWFAAERSRLANRERQALDGASQLLLSSISLWEIRAKVRVERRRGMAKLMLDPAGALAFCSRAKIGVEELSIADLLLPPLAVDPKLGDVFDEMLLVHAQRLDAKLLTRDGKLLGHPLSVF